ncbi:hypothetical protein FB45DRAFT_1065605 [Roridomyces roridus]|uniref:Uncharacterized protein n=1 Tax=Roridomyces roridus TaxID=1738132 RepID=A0AAD7FDD3_9AGAR|nr:hypothetical protein FB45DRAFT_1065605 [Roridomyces roridus]
MDAAASRNTAQTQPASFLFLPQQRPSHGSGTRFLIALRAQTRDLLSVSPQGSARRQSRLEVLEVTCAGRYDRRSRVECPNPRVIGGYESFRCDLPASLLASSQNARCATKTRRYFVFLISRRVVSSVSHVSAQSSARGHRVCEDCIKAYRRFHVISVYSALKFYELEKSDLAGLMVVHGGLKDHPSSRVKLVSEPNVGFIASQKHGGPENLERHLDTRIPRFLEAQNQSASTDYYSACSTRKKLEASGDLAGAAAVRLPSGDPIPEMPPPQAVVPSGWRFPRNSRTRPAYRKLSALRTNFLLFDAKEGRVVPTKRVS